MFDKRFVSNLELKLRVKYARYEKITRTFFCRESNFRIFQKKITVTFLVSPTLWPKYRFKLINHKKLTQFIISWTIERKK